MPASIRDRSSRFVLSHSSRAICSIDRSWSSVRVASSISVEPSSLYMRSAAIGVRSSWLTSATNSRSRSRSASSMRSVPDSRSAMTLNWWPSSSISSTPDGTARSSSSPWPRLRAIPRRRLIGHRHPARRDDPGDERDEQGQPPAEEEGAADLVEGLGAAGERVAHHDQVGGLRSVGQGHRDRGPRRLDSRVAPEALGPEPIHVRGRGRDHRPALLVDDRHRRVEGAGGELGDPRDDDGVAQLGGHDDVLAAHCSPTRFTWSRRRMPVESAANLDALLGLLGEVAREDLGDRDAGHDQADQRHQRHDQHEPDIETLEQRSGAARVEALPARRGRRLGRLSLRRRHTRRP